MTLARVQPTGICSPIPNDKISRTIVPPAALLSRPLSSLQILLTRAVATAGAIAVIWALVLIDLQHDRELIERQALVRVQGYAIGFAENLQKSIQQIDQMSLTLVRLHEQGAPAELLRESYRGILPDLPLYPIFLDERGIVRYTRTPPGMVLDLSEREFFRHHRDLASRDLRINPREEGVGAFAGKNIIRLSRRVNKADGSFGGVVAITMLPRYLNAFGETSALGNSDFSSVWLVDGPMLTNRTEGWGDRIFQHYRNPPRLPGDTGARRDPAELFRGSGTHLVGWKHLHNYPLLALVALSEANVLAPLRDTRLTHFIGAGLASLLAAMLALSNARAALRRRASREEIARAEARYRHAVDSVRDAVFVFEPVAGTGGNGPSFRIEDCNAPAVRLMNTAREHALGRDLGSLFGEGEALQLRQTLQQALAGGSSQEEIKTERRGEPAWFFVRAVRVDTSVALTLRDITELKTREQQVQSMSLTDPLTLLNNRMWLDAHLPGAMRLVALESCKLVLIRIEIDNFRLVNDALGHKAGDEILVSCAIALKRALRDSDHVARIGGHSFAIVIDKLRDTRDLKAIILQIRSALQSASWPAASGDLGRRFSIGVAVFPDHGTDPVTLLKSAEIALHAARAAGSGGTCFYEPDLLVEREERLWLEGALSHAVQSNQLRLYLQPRVSAASGRLTSFEALVRWEHPQRGLLPPSMFIPVSEETGDIHAIGAWVVRATCARLAAWRALGKPVLPVSVNVSAQQLRTTEFRRLLTDCLVEYALSPALVPIELTESTMVSDQPLVLAELARLRAMGIELHIDDFGTGYSSLAQLQQVEIDALKVDQSFVRALGVRGQGRQLCEAIIGIGKSLGATVIAEGVETIEQFLQLRAMGCDEIQGYLASPPLPEDLATALLDAPALVSVQEPANNDASEEVRR